LVVPPGHYFAMGDNRRREPGQPLLGLHSAGKHYWTADVYLLVVPRRRAINTEKRTWATASAFWRTSCWHFFDETRWRRTLRVVK